MMLTQLPIAAQAQASHQLLPVEHQLAGGTSIPLENVKEQAR